MIDGIFRVGLGCNRPNDGGFSGEVEIVDVDLDGEQLLTVDGDPLPMVKLGTVPGELTIAGESFPIEGYSCWVGNWCWDEVAMTLESVKAILSTLRARGWDLGEWVTTGPLAEVVEEWGR